MGAGRKQQQGAEDSDTDSLQDDEDLYTEDRVSTEGYIGGQEEILE
jgi:hypothetical protein